MDMAHADEIVAVISAKLDRIAQRIESAASNNNTAAVTFNGGGLMGVGLALVGLAGLGLTAHNMEMDELKRETDLKVYAAERRADMAILETLRAEMAQQGGQLRTDRILIGRLEQRLTTAGVK